VLDLNKKDFRDPKIFWHDEKKYWVMALMLSDVYVLQFYSSENLKDWKHLSDFGPIGDTSGVWECPDLTEVAVEGEPGKKKWVLQMSLNGSMQYFVGEFDGIKFSNESLPGKILRPDHGPDYYAAIAYNQLPSSVKPTAIGWVNNWYYAQDIPTTPWRSAMSIPRTFSVKKINGEWVLIQKPVESIKSLRAGAPYQLKDISVDKIKALPVRSQQFEMDVNLLIAKNSVSGIRLAAGNNKYFELGYDAVHQILYADRTNAGKDDFNDEFRKRNRYQVKLPLNKNVLNLHVFFDNSIVEVFANDGEAVMTLQIFPDPVNSGIELFSHGGQVIVKNLSLWKIKSAW
jgi:fructan beta-fructosidase